MIFLKKLWHFVYFLTGEGSWSLRPYELMAVNAALDYLGDEFRGKIEKQLENAYFVERTNNRINVTRFYTIRDNLRLDEEAFQDALIKVSTFLDGKTYMANVTFYKGLLFSVETRKPGKFFSGKKAEVLAVEIGKPSQTFTRAIDRVEHEPEN